MTKRNEKKYVTDGMWHAWSNTNVIEYSYIHRLGSGRGEAKFVNEHAVNADLDCIQGGGKAFDVYDHDGKIWEIKELPNGERDEIRLGVEAAKDCVGFWKDGIDVCESLSLFISRHSNFLTVAEHNLINEFVLETSPKIQNGEISKGSILGGTNVNKHGLFQMVEIMNLFLKRTLQNVRMVRLPEFLGNTSSIPVDEIVRLVDGIGMPDSLLVKPVEKARALLGHRYFRSPLLLTQEWLSLSRPSSVFKGVSGVVLVNELMGYVIIPASEFDNTFMFSRISQRLPKFKIAQKSGSSMVH